MRPILYKRSILLHQKSFHLMYKNPKNNFVSAPRSTSRPYVIDLQITKGFLDVHRTALRAASSDHLSTDKQQDSSIQDPPAEVQPFQSWAEDNTQDWAGLSHSQLQLPGNTTNGGIDRYNSKNPFSNALFVLAMAGIAVSAFVLGKYYNSYNRAMTSNKSMAVVVPGISPRMPSARDDATAMRINHQGQSADHSSVSSVDTIDQMNQSNERKEKDVEGDRRDTQDGTLEPSLTLPVPLRHPPSTSQQQQQRGKCEEGQKFPLRTADAEAAMARIRSIQQRRHALYDRAISRHEQQTEQHHTNQQHEEMAQIDEGETDIDQDRIPERPESIPEGMTVDNLRERAIAANKAASRAARSAHQAAASSVLAADAADKAIHAAERAALAAAQCLDALNLRSADAIEAAYEAAAKAEASAREHAMNAAVGAAKGVMSEHDANVSGNIAQKASELSRPHGIAAQSSAVVRQVRRSGEAGLKKAHEIWAEGATKMHHASESVADNAKKLWHRAQERFKSD